jgi:osomolarity two-component system response regulator SKN7
VLAKPFTKDGMLRILRKHVSHLLKNPPQEDLAVGPGGPMQAALGVPPGMNPQVRVDTPSQSPATTSSWQSPGQIHQQSPHVATIEPGFMGNPQQMVMAPGSAQRANFPPQGLPPGMQQMRVPDGMGGDDRPEKRQRLYAPQAGYTQ